VLRQHIEPGNGTEDSVLCRQEASNPTLIGQQLCWKGDEANRDCERDEPEKNKTGDLDDDLFSDLDDSELSGPGRRWARRHPWDPAGEGWRPRGDAAPPVAEMGGSMPTRPSPKVFAVRLRDGETKTMGRPCRPSGVVRAGSVGPKKFEADTCAPMASKSWAGPMTRRANPDHSHPELLRPGADAPPAGGGEASEPVADDTLQTYL
jgi:hypothetical protein